MNRLFLLVALGLCTLVGSGCSGAGDSNPPMLGDADTTTTMATPDATVACSNHEQGCACETPGDLIDCGRVKRVAGDYVWCSTGMQTCGDDKTWGACTGDATAVAPAQ